MKMTFKVEGCGGLYFPSFIMEKSDDEFSISRKEGLENEKREEH